MKRSLTIGCVLLVGGGVTNCGGSAEVGSAAGGEPGFERAGAGGSPDHSVGTIVPNYSGAGGGYVGSAIGDPVYVAGATSFAGAPGVGPEPSGGAAGSVGPGAVGAGDAGWEIGVGAGAGPGPFGGSGGEGGTAGANDEPPAIGTAPLAGSGGGFFIGDYK